MKKYRRIWVEVDLDALHHNLNEAKRVSKGAKILAVVKADGYGHGAVEIAKELHEEADYFGVALIDEALQLRRNGVTKPILILGYTSPTQYETLIEADITQAIFSREAARQLSDTAVRMGKKAKIHVVVDTGMSRIGFPPTEESVETIKWINTLPGLFVEGIFSHFALADSKDKTVDKMQLKRFGFVLDGLEREGIHIPIKHISNSAAVIDSDYSFDMVRCGIMLYGMYPSDEVDKTKVSLKPVMSLKSSVIQVKTLPPGEGVSYGHTFVTTRETRIATVSAGYGDGYPRALSSKGRVIINGQYAPIIGRVCMDIFMVDISHIDGVKVEDPVILIGRDGDKEITAEEVGALADTFNYEIVCSVSRRVPRIYLKNSVEVGEYCAFK
ncbi:MAG TPA: alanine racemase [Clostridiales bacterium]|jgi:alanine racemase|nr:alanine racemase [Clostridiales bacterium]HOJ35029.1 alanine racemase [Clostridiales bacterium]HPU67169.1 alanine racemase [Clostridiales bacterium]HQD71835.1 alanine racemase [Clostridiales bacterium]HXK83272.1 alanine racemase [Clostridiales bacterium]